MDLERPRSTEWADIPPDAVRELIQAAQGSNWRLALSAFSERHPFFVKRLSSLGLANWHVLLGRPRDASALDVGCGFGTLAAGLGHFYKSVTGVDLLEDRVEFARLRASQEGLTNTRFQLMSALRLDLAEGSIDLVTFNGVLEWAGLYAEGNPRDLQLQVLKGVKRVLAPGGLVAVAIENRFAMETLIGMEDTHTGVRLLPALPRPIAGVVARARTGLPFRTYLYSLAGYRRLFSDAGFQNIRILDLISSYNDYDFVVSTSDAVSYRFLWEKGLVRSFERRAGLARRMIVGIRPGSLGQFSYAYLVVAGDNPTTMLDATHPIWERTASWGITPGSARFAVPGATPGSIAVFTHDGVQITNMLEIGADIDLEAPPLSLVDERFRAKLAPTPRLVRAELIDGVGVRASSNPS